MSGGQVQGVGPCTVRSNLNTFESLMHHEQSPHRTPPLAPSPPLVNRRRDRHDRKHYLSVTSLYDTNEWIALLLMRNTTYIVFKTIRQGPHFSHRKLEFVSYPICEYLSLLLLFRLSIFVRKITNLFVLYFIALALEASIWSLWPTWNKPVERLLRMSTRWQPRPSKHPRILHLVRLKWRL